MALVRIKPKADIWYGMSGTRKTTQIGLVAMYVWNKYHKKTRMITLDGGGYDPLLSLVEEGIIIPWVLIGREKLTTNVIDLACQGYWPIDPDDPRSPLRSPTAATWEEIGYYAIEGVTSIGDTFIRILKRDKASLSQDPSYTYSEEAIEVDGKKRVISYSGGNMTYFGFAQDQLYDIVIKSHMLPCEKVSWSGLEGKGEEEGTRAPVYGPAIVGRKSTGKATQWFGNSLHIEQLISEQYDDKTKQTIIVERPVMYTRTHSGKDKIPFPCKHRAPFQFAEQVPVMFDPPDMGKFYQLMDELNARAIAEVRKVMAAVPAVASVAPVATAAAQPSGANGVSAEVTPSRLPAEAGTPEAPDHLETVPVPVAVPPVLAVTSPHAFVPPRITVRKP